MLWVCLPPHEQRLPAVHGARAAWSLPHLKMLVPHALPLWVRCRVANG